MEEAGRCPPPSSSPRPPPMPHSFPSWSQSHLLSLKAAGGANMYVMNISSPEHGFARELRSPGEGALPSRAWEGGGLRGVLAIASQRCRFQGPSTGPPPPPPPPPAPGRAPAPPAGASPGAGEAGGRPGGGGGRRGWPQPPTPGAALKSPPPPPPPPRGHPWHWEAQSGWGSYESGAQTLDAPWGSQAFPGVCLWLERQTRPLAQRLMLPRLKVDWHRYGQICGVCPGCHV